MPPPPREPSPRPNPEDLERLTIAGEHRKADRTVRRRSRLLTALGLVLGMTSEHGPSPVRRPPSARIDILRQWLDSWEGIGDIVEAMHALGYDLELHQFPNGWQATFYFSSVPHTLQGSAGWAASAWSAVQKAAWETLTHADTPK
jgi:hypothetical protein